MVVVYDSVIIRFCGDAQLAYPKTPSELRLLADVTREMQQVNGRITFPVDLHHYDVAFDERALSHDFERMHQLEFDDTPVINFNFVFIKKKGTEVSLLSRSTSNCYLARSGKIHTEIVQHLAKLPWVRILQDNASCCKNLA